MSYANFGGFDQSTPTTFAGNIPAGINENVKIVDIAIEDLKKDGTGGKVLRFHFQAQDGALFSHTEFAVNDAEIARNASFAKKNPQEEIVKEYQAQGSRIKHILGAFVPEEENVIDPKSWEDYMEKVLKVAGRAFDGRLFRIKLILNNKDYERFPRLPGKGGFIQPMEEPCKLVIDPKFDRIVKKEATPEADVAEADPFSAMEAAAPAAEVDPAFLGDPSMFEAPASPETPFDAPMETAAAAGEINPEEAW